MPVGFVRIVICPGATVPVGTEQDTVGELGTVAGNDVGAVERGAVVAFQFALLRDDGHAVALELADNPLLTEVVGLTVHGAGSEIALLLAEEIGTVGIEGGADGGLRLSVCCLLAEAARDSE